MKKFFFILTVLVVFFSCAENENPEKVIWVYPYKLDDDRINGYSQKGNFYLVLDSAELTFEPGHWERKDENFEIEGFDFEEGFFHKLLVSPSVSSPEKLVLKSILEKRKDYAEKIQGSWTSIPLETNSYQNTSMGIYHVGREVFIYSGCRSYEFMLREIDDQNINFHLTVMGYLDKLCWDRLENKNLNNGASLIFESKKYKLANDGLLEFFDADGKLLIRFLPKK
ncbi:MAG TPA: hypothetical protein VLA71_14945 [Algoriphagus sp.]|nr:hypothetical protein [Algoriphagus sp.]